MKNTNTKASRADVWLGNIKIEGYLLPEKLWTPTNKFGISKTQAVLLAYPSYDRNQAAKRYKRIVESQEASSPSILSTANSSSPCVVSINVHPGVEVDASGRDARKVDLLSADSIIPFLKICKKLGSQTADEMIDSLAGLSVQQLFSDAFGIQFEKEDRQQWLKLREVSKEAFWTLGDATKEYICNNANLSDDYKKYIYSNCQKAVNKRLFGKSSTEIREELGVKDLLRDHYGKKSLKRLDIIQAAAGSLIVNKNIEPYAATHQALDMFSFPIINYLE